MNLKSGYPFSLVKHGLPYDYPRLTGSIETDVVIIGGGISGALSAYYLSKEGIECIVVDARTIGLGSTCASTSLLLYEIDVPLTKLGMIRGYGNAARAYELGRRAIFKLRDIANEIGFNGFEFRKSLYFADKVRDQRWLHEEFLARKKYGFKVEWLGKHDIKKLYGFKSSAAILTAEAAQTNSYLFTHALHQHSIKKGVKVFDRTSVERITYKKDILLKTEDDLTIKARKIIHASGYETGNFLKEKIVNLSSTYATVSEQIDGEQPFWNDNTLIWNTAQPYLYIRTTSDRRIMVGGRDLPFKNAKKAEQDIPKKSKELVKEFRRIFPSIPFKSEFSWSGVFGSTYDGLPFIGQHPKFPGAYFSLGFGGNGITFSMIGAEIIADLLSGKENPDAEIFSFERV